jgi:hypothetical protein
VPFNAQSSVVPSMHVSPCLNETSCSPSITASIHIDDAALDGQQCAVCRERPASVSQAEGVAAHLVA